MESGFQTRRRCHQKSKHGYQWPHNKDLCPPKKLRIKRMWHQYVLSCYIPIRYMLPIWWKNHVVETAKIQLLRFSFQLFSLFYGPFLLFIKQFYRMTKPRLGVSVIIDNVSTPGTEADVSALQDAYETAGFEVYVYRKCDSEVKVFYRRFNLFDGCVNSALLILTFFWQKGVQRIRSSAGFKLKFLHLDLS